MSFLQKSVAQSGISPSFDEMRTHLGLASNCGVHLLLTRLEERGFIVRRKGRARAIEVVRRQGESAREAQLRNALSKIADLTVLDIARAPDLPRAMARGVLEMVTCR